MDSYAAFYQLIKDHDKITIWGHALPDGDCYGSQIGLRNLIRRTFPNKEVYAVGSGIPALFHLLGETDKVNEEQIKGSLAILVDVSCLRRVEDQRVHLASAFTKIDHHMLSENEEFSYPPFILEPERIAAAEIIADLAFQENMVFDQQAANALFLGMATDSGRFIFHGVTHHTHEVVKELEKFGLFKDKIFDIIYHEEPNEAKYKEYMRAHALLSGQVCYCVMKKEDYEKFGVVYERASAWVNCLAGKYDAPIYILCTEQPEGDIYRVELRSNKLYPVQPTAKSFGGGGHMYAAGMEIVHGDPRLETILDALNLVKRVE